MMGAVVQRRNAHVAMAIPMMGYVLAWAFPVYVNLFNRETMDQRRETDLGVRTGLSDKEVELERSVSAKEEGAQHVTEVTEEHHRPKQIGSMVF
jgi:FHS family L-fucose permease-like MFS transporter